MSRMRMMTPTNSVSGTISWVMTPNMNGKLSTITGMARARPRRPPPGVVTIGSDLAPG